jgi:thiamine biosynthesis lipoprotein
MVCWGSMFESKAQNSIPLRYELKGVAQGTTFQLIYYAQNPLIDSSDVKHVLDRMDRSMSLYREDSKISQFNRPDISFIEMDADLKAVIERSFVLYRQSAGLFDITLRPLLLWQRQSERNQTLDSIGWRKALELVGMHQLWMEGPYLHKRQAQMSIDLDGIAQGYTVDQLATLLEQKGSKNYLVELGGEIRLKGLKPDGKPFAIGIQRPIQVGDQMRLTQAVIYIPDGAITTSGTFAIDEATNQWRQVRHMDPIRGQIVGHGIVSVTVVAKEAIDCDGWDNVFMAMDPQHTIEWVDQQDELEVHLVLQLGNGQFKEMMSKGFKPFLDSAAKSAQ